MNDPTIHHNLGRHEADIENLKDSVARVENSVAAVHDDVKALLAAHEQAKGGLKTAKAILVAVSSGGGVAGGFLAALLGLLPQPTHPIPHEQPRIERPYEPDPRPVGGGAGLSNH